MQNIFPPQFESIDSHFFSDDVDLGFERESDLRAPRCPRLRARHLIGVGAKGFHVDRRAAVHARQAPAAEHGDLGVGFL